MVARDRRAEPKAVAVAEQVEPAEPAEEPATAAKDNARFEAENPRETSARVIFGFVGGEGRRASAGDLPA